MKYAKPLAGVAGLALATGIALPTMAGSGNKYAASSVTFHCSDDTATNDSGDTVALNGPLSCGRRTTR